MYKSLAVIMAGGQGERLSILSQERAKPAVPFAGKYRIIDFTLNNCVNSGVHNVIVLTQYQPLSLAEHIGIGAPWGLMPPDRSIRLLQPFLAPERGRDWYKGTADAVYQNLDHINIEDIETVLILSGDHVYKMDYSWMLEYHRQRQADVTIAVTRTNENDLHRFGTVATDENGQVTRFQEKVKQPQGNLVSMGIYLFKADILRDWLEGRAGHDFGRNIFPRMVDRSRIFAYTFEGYWRDIGTVESYWQTNMEVLGMCQPFLADGGWPIRTKEDENPPTVIYESAEIVNSLVSEGCVIEGRVEHSVLSPRVKIARGAVVKDSIIMTESCVGPDSVVDRAILDKEVVIEDGCQIGYGDDLRVNRRSPKILFTGISIVGKRAMVPSGTRIGRNCIIYDNVVESDYPSPEIESGETVRSAKRNMRLSV